jgi:serine/threonine protein kinase
MDYMVIRNRVEEKLGRPMSEEEKEVVKKLLTASAAGKESGKAKAIGVDDFDLLKVLGKGSFGKVMLVRHKGTQQIHAMKTLRKSQLLRRNQLAHTATERGVLQKITSPFLMSLDYAWQSDTKLYMVMGFCQGGELFHWLKKQKRFSLKRVLLYTAEMLLAIETLHSHDVVYRDLKPENVLLNAQGHVKLTDFGLSKEGVSGAGSEEGTSTFCGTPEYLAPEILENKGHGKAVDWWSLGTLMYEMLVGLPPFYDKNMKKMYDKILHQEIAFPGI